MLKRLLIWGFMLMLAVSLSACEAGEGVVEEAPPVPELAEEPALEEPEEAPVEEAAAEGEAVPVEVEEVTTPNVLRGTDLATYNVINFDGEDLGDTEDVMITLKDGQIDYLVLTFGGFLGMGRQNFLIPWEAVEVAPELNAFMTNVLTREALAEAPTFEPDAWPDTAVPDWDADVIAYWESQGVTVEREPVAPPEVAATPAITETPEVTATVEVTGTPEAAETPTAEEEAAPEAEEETTPEAEVTPEAEEEAAPEAAETPEAEETPEVSEAPAEEVRVQIPRSVRLSVLLDYTVRNPAGVGAGELEDLMINWREGRVAYAVLSFGGGFFTADKWFAIPLNALTVNPVERTVVIDIEPEMLEAAPGFDRENWPEAASPDWDEEIRQFWEERQRELEEMQQPLEDVLPVETPAGEEAPEAEATPTPAPE